MWNQNSVTRVTSASRYLPSDAEQLSRVTEFSFAPNNHYRFFFLHVLPSTIAFRSDYVSFYQFHAGINTFSSKKCSVRLLCKKLTSKLLAQNDVKMSKSAAPVTEWLRPLLFIALNHSSSHRCGFEPRSGHM